MSNNNLKLVGNDTIVPNGEIHGSFEIEPVLFLNHDGCVIDSNTYVTIDEYTQHDEYYFDILLHKKNEIIPLGRYIKESKVILVSNKDDKLLIYYANYDYKKGGLSKIIKVINLYNIKDDIFYNVTEKEALNLYDRNLDSDNLIDPDNKIVNYSINKKQKVLKKGINRFSYYGD